MVGPLTVMTPPETFKLPLESSPSPPASTWTLPPKIVIEAFASLWKGSPPKRPKPLEPSLPPAALKPSSLAVTSISPPETSMTCASSPS